MILIASNPFKGTYTAVQATMGIARGLRRAGYRGSFRFLPLADGGRGTLEVLSRVKGGTWHTARVRNPLGQWRTAKWLEWPGRTAVIESAEAIGWPTIPRSALNPFRAASWGVGDLMENAVNRGMRHLVIGLGDSVTVDGGTGMLEALGLELVNNKGEKVGAGGRGLSEIAGYYVSPKFLRLQKSLSRVTVLCDVAAPLIGSMGAARRFGPQKGASPQQVRQLEKGMTGWGRLLNAYAGMDVMRKKGAGAAGGLGGALAGFLGAEIASGGDWMLRTMEMARHMKHASLVITGEGRLDQQSLLGKAPWRVALMARSHRVPCVFVCGSSVLARNKVPHGVQVRELAGRTIDQAISVLGVIRGNRKPSKG